MSISENRLKHCYAVAKFMKQQAENKGWPQEKCNEMFVLGLFHDIGYEFTDNPFEHAKVGGKLLKKEGYTYWKEIYHHGNPNTYYKSEELDLLNVADLSIDSYGNIVGVELRLQDILNRYGKKSRQYQEAKALAISLNLLK